MVRYYNTCSPNSTRNFPYKLSQIYSSHLSNAHVPKTHSASAEDMPQKLWFLVRAQGCSLESSGSETALESADREVPME